MFSVETVSVVIPMLDAAQTIGQQLHALSNQTYSGEVEIIVVDNGSNDDSREMAARWSGDLSNLRVIDATDKKSPGYARNIGTKVSDARIILYCDADDIVASDWIERIVANLAYADIVGSRFDVTSLRNLHHVDVDAIQASDPNLEPLPSGVFLQWAGGSGCGIRREVFDTIGYWREDGAIGEDVDFSWRAQLAGYALVIADDAIVFWRPPRTLTMQLKREFRAGFHAPLLYKEFKRHGVHRRPLTTLVRHLAILALKVPLIALTKSRRGPWMGQIAGQLGRFFGSIRHRSLYL